MARNVAVAGEQAAPSLPEWEALRADLAKYYRIAYGTEAPTLRERLRLWLTSSGFHCVAVHRLGELSWRLKGERPVAWLLCGGLFHALDLAVNLVHHVDIAARVGPGFYIGHPSTIYIGETRIGRNFSVTHNVTIGLGQSRGKEGLPAIGDDVWIGTGSIVYGDIQVGDGATIASGTVLSKSVPPRALVGGNPGRVLASDYDNGQLLADRSRGPRAPDPSPNGEPRPTTR